MNYRGAVMEDYKWLEKICRAVNDNGTSGAMDITLAEYEKIISSSGRGWVCEYNNEIVGFSVLDIANRSIKEFVMPDKEGLGIGRGLHNLTVNWAFKEKNMRNLWITTYGSSRAELFYLKSGWLPSKDEKSGMIKLGLKRKDWLNKPRILVSHG